MRNVLLVSLLGVLAPHPAVSSPSDPSEAEERIERLRRGQDWMRPRLLAKEPRLLAERALEALARERRRRPAAGTETPAWTNLGPLHTSGEESDSGMIDAIATHPTDPRTLWVGPNGGGVWKTTDGGGSWRCTTDGLGTTLMGALAVAPSDPRVVYAGTGAGCTGQFDIFPKGIGLLASSDGGETWHLTAGDAAGLFFAISVDPRDPRTLLVAGDRGIQRSTDGGDSFTRVVLGNDGWGTSLVRSSTNADVVWAATVRASYNCIAGPPIESAVWKSTDGGRTFAERSSGLPRPDTGIRTHIALAGAPSRPDTLYALLSRNNLNGAGCTFDLGTMLDVARSTDGGETWTPNHVTSAAILGTQATYANAISVDPANPDVVYAGGLQSWKSTDAGRTWALMGAHHVDQHGHARGADGALYLVNDGGIFVTRDGGATFQDLNRGLATLQFYTLCASAQLPDRLHGGTQDNGTALRTSGNEWAHVLGGDGFGCWTHPSDPHVLLASYQSENIFRSTDGGLVFRRATFGLTDANGDESVFNTVLRGSTTDASTVYAGARRRIFISTNAGSIWSALSAPVLDAPSSLSDFDVSGTMIAAVTTRGQMGVSHDGGATFVARSSLPRTGSYIYALALRIDRHDPATLWAAAAAPDLGRGRIFRSTDEGTTWSDVSHAGEPNGLPDVTVLDVESDPDTAGVAWAGTYLGVFRTVDGGRSWQRYGSGLPNVPVWAIAFVPGKVRAGTYGRGAWEAPLVSPPADQPPTAEITEPSGAGARDAGLPLRFTGVGTDPDAGDVLTYVWDFGDGRTGAGVAVTHSYATPGSYTASLTVRDAAGATARAQVSVTVRAPSPDGPARHLPVVLDVVGVGSARYTTDLTFGSRAAVPVTVLLSYTASLGSGSGFASVELAPGEWRVVSDAIGFLRGEGLAIPADGSPQAGTLRAVFLSASEGEAFLSARTATPGGGGSYGLAYGPTASSETALVVAGLQEDAKTRANLALVNAGADPVTLRVALTGPAGEDLGSLPDVTLDAYGWTQVNRPLLGNAAAGRARVTRVGGVGRFGAYGVLNDAITSDGSFLEPLVPGDATGADRLVPIVLDAAGLGGSRFTTELTLANLGAVPLSLTLVYTASPALSGGPGSGSAPLSLAAGEQRIVPDAVAFLREAGLAIPAGAANVGGALLVRAPAGTSADALAVSARTTNPAPTGGTFGLSYPGLTSGGCAAGIAFVGGLRQDATQRSNLALVNRGDAADAITLRVTLTGPSGEALGAPVEVTLAPGEWRQLNQPLGPFGVSPGLARVEKLSGASRFAAYGVLNDAAISDGSYLAMSVP